MFPRETAIKPCLLKDDPNLQSLRRTLEQRRTQYQFVSPTLLPTNVVLGMLRTALIHSRPSPAGLPKSRHHLFDAGTDPSLAERGFAAPETQLAIQMSQQHLRVIEQETVSSRCVAGFVFHLPWLCINCINT